MIQSFGVEIGDLAECANCGIRDVDGNNNAHAGMVDRNNRKCPEKKRKQIMSFEKCFFHCCQNDN